MRRRNSLWDGAVVGAARSECTTKSKSTGAIETGRIRTTMQRLRGIRKYSSGFGDRSGRFQCVAHIWTNRRSSANAGLEHGFAGIERTRDESLLDENLQHLHALENDEINLIGGKLCAG